MSTKLNIYNHDLINMKMGYNVLLLKQVSKNNEIRFSDGSRFYLDPTWLPEDHIDLVFQVVYTPSQLIYSRDYHPDYSMPWLCQNEARPGDIVWVNYNKAINPIGRVHCIDTGEDFILMKYQWIHAILRPWSPAEHGFGIYVECQQKKIDNRVGFIYTDHELDQIQLLDEEDNTHNLPEDVLVLKTHIDPNNTVNHRLYQVVIPNGYVLFKLKEKIKTTELIELDSKYFDPETRFGEVVLFGRPNTEYYENYFFDDDYITSGHVIHLKNKYYKNLENKSHAIFPIADLKVIQRKHILGVFNPQALPMDISEVQKIMDP